MKLEKILKRSATSIILIGITFILWVVINSVHETPEVGEKKSDKTHKIEKITAKTDRRSVLSPQIKAEVKSDSEQEEGLEESEQEFEPEKTEEEKKADEEERRVEEFDKLTDKWMEPSKKAISQNDIAAFLTSFKAVPESRRDECVHRALNLIPDDNVLLLAGIMFDKSLGKETIETVFNDILNRDETVKKPIMKQIFQDKSHPCWADVAWILDVTGELPGKKQE